MIRFFDLLFALLGLILGLPIFIFLLVLGFLDTGSPVFIQERVGRYGRPFQLRKFRTMRKETESVPSHEANASAITRFGGLLRRTKLDELPQLWNVLKGEMSLVGPRPCLFSQTKLIRERSERGVDQYRPGITGLAQINGIDMSTPELLAQTDQRMLDSLTIRSYFKYILLTVAGNGSGDRVPGED